MDQEKAKFDIFTNKISLILLFILGFFISVFGVGTFALYFILNTLGFSYALLVMTAFALALMIIYKEKNKLILSSIILLGISIIYNLLLFSRDYVLFHINHSWPLDFKFIVIAILYKIIFIKTNQKCKISSSTVSKITTIVIAIICIICTVILHTFAINAIL